MKTGLLKRMTALVMSSMMIFSVGMVSEAASKTKIKTVSLEVIADIIPGTDYGMEELEVDVKTSNCSFDSYEIMNEDNEWEANTVPKLKLYLSAEDGYYFYITKASSVKLKGATYVSASREDSSTTLILTVSLPPLDEYVQEIEHAYLNRDGSASWTAAVGAATYDVRLLRDGKTVGGTRTVTENSINVATLMTREGSYLIKVKPINGVKTENTGSWTPSDSVVVDAALAEQNKILAAIPEGEWVQDSVGWWYRNFDGSFTTNNWQKISELWYFFDQSGYMKTGWIEWQGKQYYCDANGAMLVNTTTPDGYHVGIDGAVY